MVNACAALPGESDVGEREVIAGTGLLTTRFTAVEDPPPGVALVTITAKLPIAAKSATLSWIVSFPVLTNVAAWATALYVTVEAGTKPEPLTARVCAALPTVSEAGEREVIAGTGLLTIRFAAGEEPPPGAGL